MSYIKNNLMAGEQLVYRTNLHWIVFGWAGFWILFSLPSLLGSNNNAGAAGFIAIGLLLATIALINFKTSEFGVTNKRILVKVGFIRRQSNETLLSKVEGIQINQGIIGRILNFGTVVIRGTGGGKDEYKKISDPMELRRRVQTQIEIYNTKNK